jgi:hypothetical protein
MKRFMMLLVLANFMGSCSCMKGSCDAVKAEEKKCDAGCKENCEAKKK